MPYPQTTEQNTRYWILAGLLVLGLTFVLPEEGFGGTHCLSKMVTEHPCPGCGVTRSITALSHGHPKLAWSFNPLGYVVYSVLLVLALSLIPAVRRWILIPLLTAYKLPPNWLWATGVAALLLFWLSRVLFGTWWSPGFVPPRPI